MIICAGSVMYSADGVLYLDKYIFSRDVAAYFLSLVMLIWSLKGNPIAALGNMFSSGVENECLNVTIYHALALLLLYACYATVSGNFQAFLKKFDLVHENLAPDEHGQQGGRDGENSLRQSLLDMSPIPEDASSSQHDDDDETILSVLTSAVQDSTESQNRKGPPPSMSTPAAMSTSYSYRSRRLTAGQSMRGQSHNHQQNSMSRHGQSQSQQKSTFVKDQAMFSWRSSNFRGAVLGGDIEADPSMLRRKSNAGVIGPAASGYHSCLRLVGSEANEDELGTMEISELSLSGFLFLKSSFYNMKCCPVLKSWRLRYFTIDRHGLHSRKIRESSLKGPQIEMIDLQTCQDVEITDRTRGLFVVHRLSGTEERPYEFAATSLELLDEVVRRLSVLIQEAQARSSEQKLQFNRKAR